MLQAQRPVAGSTRKASAAHRSYGVHSVPSRVSSVIVQASAVHTQTREPEVDRRSLLAGASTLALTLAGPAFAAKVPKGFNTCEDRNDGYKFLYPFGWQEVAVNGADVVFKDIVEPLESVSVTMAKTERNDITEFGEIQEVAETLAKDVLTGPEQQVKVLSTNQRELNGRVYYEFEFTADNGKFTRHQLAVVAAANNTFYTLTTGANERRWNKMKDRLQTTVRSFTLLV